MVVPLLLALYASYPPAGVVVERVRVVKQEADTAEEAAEQGVEVGEEYVVRQETVKKRWLPLAAGPKDTEVRRLERLEDGAWVEEHITRVRGQIKLGLDLAGGTELLYRLNPQEGQRLEEGAGQVIDILKKRIDPGNVKEYRIQAAGTDRVLIQVPRATTAEVEQLKNRLQTMGKLEFKIAVPRRSGKQRFEEMYAQAQAGEVPPEYVRMWVDGDRSVPFALIKKGEAAITGERLANVYPTVDENGAPAVGFEFDAVGARRFAHITESNLGWSLAIILDGVLKSAPVIETRIAGAGIIRGRFSQQDVSDMVNVLRAGSLPMDITLLQESTVGPKLGRDSIRRGLLALAVAGLLVVGFIGFYYMGCGLVADGALLMNLVLLIGILSLLGAALTLPGMAGILLTVGMAVDANVLIFERIREESDSGKGVRIALRNGYDRAFTTIVDANVTTLLTAVILYLVGTGPVRGFAVTLSFGILLSMFTALVVTRLAFETFIEKGWMERFRMLSLVGTPSIEFARIRKPAYFISAVVVAGGLVAFFTRGPALYDIDFTGGVLVNVSLAEPTPVSDVRSRLAAAGYPDAEVQAFRAAGAGQGAPTDFSIRLKGAGRNKVKDNILPPVKARLEAAGLIAEGKEKKRIDVARDGRSLELALDAPAEEMGIRHAIGGENAFALEQISNVVPTDEEVLSRELTVYVGDVRTAAGRGEVWRRAILALGWAGLEGEDYEVTECRWNEARNALVFALDKPIRPELLAVELARRQFAQVEVAPAGAAEWAPAEQFLIRAEADLLEQFQRELPAGAELRGVPTVQIEGDALTATLTKEYSEQDIRVRFEREDLEEARIVLLGAQSARWRLELSQEPVRDTMRSLFADVAPRAGGVRFETMSEGDGQRIVEMQLENPMPFGDVRNYIETADVGVSGDALIVDFDDYEVGTVVSQLRLTVPADDADAVLSRMEDAFGRPEPVQKVISIGAEVAQELQGRALMAVLFASVIIVLYVAARFHAFRFGVAAVIALLHDVLITAGLVALADWLGVFGEVKINLAMLAAFLTILGYSLNDTIVVFDRIRENMGILGRNRVSGDLIDMSINQTLSRTVLTSMTTLMVVVVLAVVGGPVLRGLALTLIFGVLVGTYSSMFIASPVLLDWEALLRAFRGFFRVVSLPFRLPFKVLSLAFGTR
ncbi:MAG: protein translocase subunit SecD [Candidatus Brocadiia bacterium]